METKVEAINLDDIKIELEDGYYNITIDDESDTYKTLIELGKSLKENCTEDEAFEVALKYVIENVKEKRNAE
jgi:hypothetical protein